MKHLSPPLTLALRGPTPPDELYGVAYQHFQTRFRTLPPGTDVRGTWLWAHVPDGVRGNREKLGIVLTGAILAMFSHEADSTEQLLPAIMGSTELLLPLVESLSPKDLAKMDEIIITQGVVTGAPLQASDLVILRVLIWELHDYAKMQRWLRALDKAARIRSEKIINRKTDKRAALPLSDPFLRIVKNLAVPQLQIMIELLQTKLRGLRVRATDQQIFEAFAEQAQVPDVPFLSGPHNYELWLRFYRKEPLHFSQLSPEKLFDEFVGFVTKHDPVYMGKVISSLS